MSHVNMESSTKLFGRSDEERPLAIDLFTGFHGWSEGLVAEGWRVIGFDLEDMCGQFGMPRPEHVQLVLQNVLTIVGSQFRDADSIVASPPCTEFSYMAMPWKRAKQIARALRGDDEFPDGYRGSRTVADLTALFDACFRIQREASAAAGRHIPMVVENVKGAQPWVVRAKSMFGSFALWGDVPALMPAAVNAVKAPGMNWSDQTKRGQDFTRLAGRHALDNVIKQPGIHGQRANGKGDRWFQDGAARHGSKSKARKAASAMIAKIPLVLATHIARTYRP